ncbi:MAG: hypothetical protein HY559_05580 [Gammaproteobacteria bacterium]|nr:hypothetical protein [Gammaproteobacteria bacterium]
MQTTLNTKALIAIAFFAALLVTTFWQIGGNFVQALLAGVFMVATLLYARSSTTSLVDAAALLGGLLVLYVLSKAALLAPQAFTPAVLAASFAAGLFSEGFFPKAKMGTKGTTMGVAFAVFLLAMGYPMEGKDFPSFAIVFFWGMTATIGSPALVNMMLLRKQ